MLRLRNNFSTLLILNSGPKPEVVAMDRRSFLQAGALTLVAAKAPDTPKTLSRKKRPYQKGLSPWPLTLNTSTIRPASLDDKIAAAVEAGYDGIELWVNELEKYEADGGNLQDLGKRIADEGLFVPNIIGLWGCMPPSEEEFNASLEATRNRMRMAAAVGSRHVAAIPQPDREDFDLKWGAECYRRLLTIGKDEFGITVAFEFVGFFKGVHRLGQASAVALDANHPDACLIMDTFHLYRGGSGYEGVRHIQGHFIADFHWNDVPPVPSREELGDEHRLLPGEGILPLSDVLQSLVAIDYRGPLSLEIFRREYWEQDPKKIAKQGIDAMRRVIDLALS